MPENQSIKTGVFLVSTSQRQDKYTLRERRILKEHNSDPVSPSLLPSCFHLLTPTYKCSFWQTYEEFNIYLANMMRNKQTRKYMIYGERENDTERNRAQTRTQNIPEKEINVLKVS